MRQAIISFCFLCAALTVCLTSSLISTSPKALKASSSLKLFSAERALTHVRRIASSPHSMGTAAHASVRKYILSECKKLGLETEIQNVTSARKINGRVLAGNVYNVIAFVKGQSGNKAILIMAHYDSKPNTLGAGDNAAGVSTLLETARALKASKSLMNDVILLFTDGEENKLLGANAFVTEKKFMDKIALVINLDGRGNTGSSIMFETNSENGWIMQEYAKAAAYPLANSLFYELYKIIPNDTDYSIFKNAGIAGLNHAFIGGLVNYHSMTDTPQNLDINSLQHHGDNMYSLVKHFGNIALEKVKQPDVSYFNLIGNWFLYYSATWNVILIWGTAILMLIILRIGFNGKRFTKLGLLAGILIFPTLIIISALAVLSLVLTVNVINPEYNNFMSGNSYNSKYYFVAITTIGIAVIVQPFIWLCKKFNIESVLTGALITVLIILIVFYNFVPSATYIIFIPLYFLQLEMLFFISKRLDRNSIMYNTVSLLGSFPALVLLSPLLYLMFTAFGLSILSLLTMLVVNLIILSLLPLINSVFINRSYMPTILSLSVCLSSLLLAQFNSSFSINSPLQTYIRYELNASTKKASWITVDKTDFGNQKFFTNSKTDPQDPTQLINNAPVYPLPVPIVRVVSDTIRGDKRRIELFCSSIRKASGISLIFNPEDKFYKLFVNKKEVMFDDDLSSISNIEYSGNSGKGVLITLEKELGPLDCWIEDQTIGLPDSKGKNTYVSGTIPSYEYKSNTTIVKQHYIF